MRLKNTKAKGSRNERKAMAWYAALGYKCIKAGASLGEFDVWALGEHDGYLVQVKTNSKVSKAEVARMESFQCPPFMHKVLFIWHDRVKEPEIIPIARSRPEKEAVDMVTHPVHGPRKAGVCTCPSKTNGCIDCGRLPG